MPTRHHTVFGQDGTVIEEYDVEIPQEEANADEVQDQLRNLRANLTTAYNAMDTIANGTGNMTAAQLTVAMRQVASAVRFALRTEGRIVRALVNDYSGTD
jgi:hypothetical protein